MPNGNVVIQRLTIKLCSKLGQIASELCCVQDLDLINTFGCCLVDSCRELRKGESVQSLVHLGRNTIPGW